MFTATELRFVKENYPEKLEDLLENLGIEKTGLNDIEEIENYEKPDEKIVSSLCKKMKSDSIIDGYAKLMKLGNLPLDYSETYNGLLDTILDRQNEIKNCLEDKISKSKKMSSDVESEEYNYGEVEIQFSRANFEKKFYQNKTSEFVLLNRKILPVPSDLKDKVKNLICEYFRERETFNVVKSIEVSVETQNGVYEKKFSLSSNSSVEIESLPFNQNELTEVFSSLKLVDDIVKSI